MTWVYLELQKFSLIFLYVRFSALLLKTAAYPDERVER